MEVRSKYTRFHTYYPIQTSSSCMCGIWSLNRSLLAAEPLSLSSREQGSIPSKFAFNCLSFLDPLLKTCSHVFLRRVRVRRPLQPSNGGPCQVRLRDDKAFKALTKNGREDTVSADRLKAAAIETTRCLVSDHPAPSCGPAPVNSAAAATPKSAKSNNATKQTTSSARSFCNSFKRLQISPNGIILLSDDLLLFVGLLLHIIYQ